MTRKRDLKRRVRERQTETGESYVTALRRVRARRPGAFPVLEMIDLTAAAAALGLRCRVSMTPQLAARVDGAHALARLRDTLHATENDPALARLRAAALRGEAAGNPNLILPRDLEVGRRFLARVRAGIGGVSDHGHVLALTVDGKRGAEMVVFRIWPFSAAFAGRAPSLIVSSTDGLAAEPFIAWEERP